MKRTVLIIVASFLILGCTHVVKYPGASEMYVTTEDYADFKEPYTPLGMIQTTKVGFAILGIPLVAPESLIETAINDTLLTEVQNMGGDGIVGVRWQYVPGNFFPLVLVSGQAIRRGSGR
ncbi:MAG: hypothetical protein RX316_10800 [bacterium]|nr:hypothetical protein [bacterium]